MNLTLNTLGGLQDFMTSSSWKKKVEIMKEEKTGEEEEEEYTREKRILHIENIEQKKEGK